MASLFLGTPASLPEKVYGLDAYSSIQRLRNRLWGVDCDGFAAL